MNWRQAVKLLLSISLLIGPFRFSMAEDSNEQTVVSDTSQETSADNTPIDSSLFEPKDENTSTNAETDENILNEDKCPMLDDKPYADLKSSVDALTSAINPTKCTDPNDKTLVDASNRLVSTRKDLEHDWKEFDRVGEPGNADVDIEGFTSNIESMMNTVNIINTELGNSKFRNKTCVKELDSLGILAALGDIASSLAPFAILGASMNPQWKAGVKGIIGLTGIGSASKVINQVRENDQKMDTPPNRENLLRNVCEFAKLDRKLKRLDLNRASEFGVAATAQIKQDLAKKMRAKERIFGRLMSKTNRNSEVRRYLSIRNSHLAGLLIIERQLKADRSAFRELAADYGNLGQFGRVSTAGNGTAESSPSRDYLSNEERQSKSVNLCIRLTTYMSGESNSVFPFSAIANLSAVQSLAVLNSTDKARAMHIESLLAADRKLRQSFKERGTDCERDAFPYLENLKSILVKTRTMAIETRSSVKDLANLDPQVEESTKAELLKYHKDEERIERETTELTRLNKIFENLKEDPATIPISEMSSAMHQLYLSLFAEGNSFFRTLKKTSPAMAWINQIGRFYFDASRIFESALQQEIDKHAKYFPLDPGLRKKVPGAAMPMLSSSLWQSLSFWWTGDQKKIEDNQVAAKKFTAYTTANLPFNSPGHVQVCRSLVDLQRKWINAWDHLLAQRYFCREIESFLMNEADVELVRYCQGIISPKVNQANPSQPIYEDVPGIQKKMMSWEAKGKESAEIIRARINELNCKSLQVNKISSSTASPRIVPEKEETVTEDPSEHRHGHRPEKKSKKKIGLIADEKN